jgi:hypothetical protein
MAEAARHAPGLPFRLSDTSTEEGLFTRICAPCKRAPFRRTWLTLQIVVALPGFRAICGEREMFICSTGVIILRRIRILRVYDRAAINYSQS